MEIKYIFSNPTDLYDKDSSLSPGWFVIDDTEVFRESKCMVTIAISDLIEGLNHIIRYKSGGFSWSPADSGETVWFRRSGNKISFHYKTKKFETEFDMLYKSAFALGNAFILELLHLRNEVTTEAAYIDLTNILKN